ncbi:MAG: hypothetical protein V1750_03795 [Acidobacteriota bacterium]
MGPARVGIKVLAALAVGAAVGWLSGLGGEPGPLSRHGNCFRSLRMLRFAVSAFAAQHGRLPGTSDSSGSAITELPAAELEQLVTRQLTEPRDASGWPSLQGPWRGLLSELPANPYTMSRRLVVAPAGEDALAFAAASAAGWAYLPMAGQDHSGPLPAGLILPCGRDRAAGGDGGFAVQKIAFEIEDFERWR